MSFIFIMKLIQNQTSFNGILYGRKNYSLSEPIYTCKYGDRLLVSTFVDAFQNGTEVKISKDPGFNKVVLESDLNLKFDLFDRMRFLISKEQIEMLKKKSNGEYDTLVYVLSEDDFANLKLKKSKSFQDKIKQFSGILQKNAPENLKDFIKKYFV